MTIGKDLDSFIESVTNEIKVLTEIADKVTDKLIKNTEEIKNLNDTISSLEEQIKVLKELVEGDGDGQEEPFPWKVFLLNLNTSEKKEITETGIIIPQGSDTFTIEVGEGEAADVVRPVTFTLNGQQIGAENVVPIHAAGDNNPVNFKEGLNQLNISSADGKSVDISIEKKSEDVDPDPNPEPAPYEMQVGPWFPLPFNVEDPLINYINPSEMFWDQGSKTTPQLVAEGVIDTKTGLPNVYSGSVQSGIYFSVGMNTHLMHLRDGDWVLEGDGEATLKARNLGADRQQQTGPCRLEFSRNAKDGETPWDERFYVSNIKKKINTLKLYRKEHEDLVKQGKIWNPDFINRVSGYDIIRTMDLQSTNGSVIRSVDDLATMNAAFWGNNDWSNATGEEWMRWGNYYQSMPLEAVFKLGVESGKKLWVQCPITLGAPVALFDSSVRPDDDRRDIWAHRFAEKAKEVAVDVLESSEWDRYADKFVEDLINSGYPEDRVIYTSVANEVWNWAGHYFLTTKYAQLLGEGLGNYLGINTGAREVYGAIVSRLKLAIDKSLEVSGRNQKIVFVLEGQNANPYLTKVAIEGAKAFIEKKGENWEDHRKDFATSVASYFGWEDPTSKGVDVNNLEELADYFINGPETEAGTLKNVVKLIKENINYSKEYGVDFIGFYEGSWHFGRPNSMTHENYKNFIWGELGGKVNYEINKELTRQFPGVILSNYALGGASGGQPWFEDILNPSPYSESWDRLIAEKNNA